MSFQQSDPSVSKELTWDIVQDGATTRIELPWSVVLQACVGGSLAVNDDDYRIVDMSVTPTHDGRGYLWLKPLREVQQ